MSEPSRPVRKRRRPPISCEECRRRKIKCDRVQPCKHCRQLNTSCVFPDGSTPLSFRDVSEARLPRIAPPRTATPIVALPLDNPSIVGIRDENREESPSNISKIPNLPIMQTESSEDSPRVRALIKKVQRLEQLLSTHREAEASSLPSQPPFGEPRDQSRGIFSKARYFGPSHWMNAVGSFDKIAATGDFLSIGTLSFNNAILSTNVPSVLKKCKALAKSSKMKIYNEWLADRDFRASIPALETSKILLDAYFRTSESAFRIFHIPTFKKEYEQYQQYPHLANDSFILNILLAMAIGITFYQEPDAEILRTQAKKWFYAADAWLSESPHQKSRLNIAGLQMHCLLLIARQSLGMVEDMVWISAGSLVRRAFSMGLHRDPKYFPQMKPLQAEIRRRLWATIVELNLQFSVDSGTQPLISMDHDFDTEAPANINDEDIDENTTISPVSKSSDVFTQSSVQIILMSSLRTRIEILQVCNTLSAEPPYEKVSTLGDIMMKKCRESGALMRKFQNGESIPKPAQLECNILDIYLRRFTLILYFPFSTKSQDNPNHYFARKQCVDAAMTMISYPSNETGTKQSLKEYPYDNYTCLKTRSCGFFEMAFLHSTIVLFFELVNQLKEQAPFISQSKDFRQPIKNLIIDARDLLAVRIAVAENNVKGYLLFSAALGQTEAIEAGTSPSQGAVEGARRGAEVCLGLLGDKLHLLEPEVELDSTVQDELEFCMQEWSMDFVMPDAWGWDGGQFDVGNLTVT